MKGHHNWRGQRSRSRLPIMIVCCSIFAIALISLRVHTSIASRTDVLVSHSYKEVHLAHRQDNVTIPKKDRDGGHSVEFGNLTTNRGTALPIQSWTLPPNHSRVDLVLWPRGAPDGPEHSRIPEPSASRALRVPLALLEPLATAMVTGCVRSEGTTQPRCYLPRAEAVPKNWSVGGFRGPPYALAQFLTYAPRAAVTAAARAGRQDALPRGAVALIEPKGGDGSGEVGAWMFVALADHVEWRGAFPVVGMVIPRWDGAVGTGGTDADHADLTALEDLAEGRVAGHVVRPAVWGQTAVREVAPNVAVSFERPLGAG
eukprot:TRINITY_DN13501_c0_g1_i1.p1 TRINITY_DN13501_c0_g1~~TRINITY_DN13501_c0_g1_i1.p1  ORF type:complete len:315 (+),score=22.73 TRINITY_DN13501_c0_g1_i1:37-981(+)